MALLATSNLGAQSLKPEPRPDSLWAIFSRGKLLAEYDFAAWHATDAVVARRPAPDEVSLYLALPEAAGWSVAFGHMSAEGDAFLITYLAHSTRARPDSFTVEHLLPAKPDSDYFLRGARAVALARRTFGAQRRPYNVAAWQFGNSPATAQWLVYLLPAQTQAGIWPLGGDVRYRISHDGSTILETRVMHKAILETPSRESAPGEPKAGMHTAILDDIPEDSDVFHVLVRAPRVPELIVTDAFVYQIDPDGMIRLLGRRETLLGR